MAGWTVQLALSNTAQTIAPISAQTRCLRTPPKKVRLIRSQISTRSTLWHSSYIEIYIGNVRVMHAANTQADVIISDVSGSGFAHWFKVPYVTCAENVALNMTVAFFTIWWYNQFNKSDFMKLIVIVKGECICGLSI